MSESSHEVALLERGKRHDLAAPSSALPVGGQDNAGKNKPRTQVEEAVLDVVFGSTSGMVGKIIEYPFDTVKVRLQSSTRYAGPLDCFSQSLRAEGIAGLYRGTSAPMLGAAIETSSLFFSYRLAQRAVEKIWFPQKEKDESLPLSALLVCGAASGAFTSMLLTPIELVKCQMQVPADTYAGSNGQAVAQRSPFGVVASIYKHGGITAFWRGQIGTLIRETGGSAAWFGSYEGIKALFRRRKADILRANGMPQGEIQEAAKKTQPIWEQMAAGACAGMAYNFAFYPADTIKSRMQTEQVGGGTSTFGPKVTFFDVGRTLWKEQGLRGMYRGCGITVGRAAPSSAFIFSIYETLRAWFG